MKSELSFLLELVLDETIPKPIKTRLVARIRDVEKAFEGTRSIPQKAKVTQSNNPQVAIQALSTQRLMEQHPDLVPQAKPPQPVTPAAAQALAQRQAMINAAINGKEDKERTSPRKA